MSLVVKKRKKKKRVHFNQHVEIKHQKADGNWSIRQQPMRLIPYTSIYNQLVPFVSGDVNLLMPDIVLLVLRERLPNGMSEASMLDQVLRETYQREHLRHFRGWVQLGAFKVYSKRDLVRLIRGFEEAKRDLEEHNDLYEIDDKPATEQKYSHQAKRQRKTYEILNDLTLVF